MSNRHSDIPMMDGGQRRASAEDDLTKKNFTHVRVMHNFRGSNNDELCMKKDDVSLDLEGGGGMKDLVLDQSSWYQPENPMISTESNLKP